MPAGGRGAALHLAGHLLQLSALYHPSQVGTLVLQGRRTRKPCAVGAAPRLKTAKFNRPS